MFRTRCPLAALTVALLTATAPPPAAATVLVFNNDFGLEPIADSGFNNTGANYGDRVAASAQGDFEYGSTGGFTPNVIVTYGANPTGSTFHGATTGFGDLVRVAFGTSTTNDFISEITLTSDLNFLVRLSSFDVGGAPTTDRLANVTVLDQANNVLFSLPNAPIEGNLGHTTFDFGTPLVGVILRIRLQSVGPNAANSVLGFDNISFSQTPEPSTLAGLTVLVASAWPLVRRRRSPRR
jgi:hypothetical protein